MAGRISTVFLAAILAWSISALAQTTNNSSDVGPLNIHVTAVEGAAQYRPPNQTKWRTLTAGIDLTEGAEFRTGPKGAIQFTVGTDQVYRVDRLTVVKVLRAALLPDGTIKTDVGMTYGRVSKDVDAPVHPHDDTITAPGTTLAVRGTRVSLYDQPPYQTEAVSLTGSAIFQNLHGELVAFGAKGGGKAKVSGNSDSAADTALSTSFVDPSGAFAGRTASEQQLITFFNGNPPGIFQQLVVGQTLSKYQSLVGAAAGSFQIGELQFPMFWTGTPFSVVNYTVQAPDGELVTPTSPGFIPGPNGTGTPITTTTGGFYLIGGGLGTKADSSGLGQQEVDWGALPISGQSKNGTFPLGNYTITETLQGTTTQSLAQNPSVQVTTNSFADEFKSAKNKSGFTESTATVTRATLNAASPTVTYTVTVPIKTGEPLVRH